MYAIVEISGKQYRVNKDMKLKVPRQDSDPGKKVGFDRVLLLEDEKGKTTIGNPLVKNMLVNATIVEHGRDKKVIIFKKKRRKGHQKSQGHRQGFSIIEINTIGTGALKKEVPAAKAVAEKKEAPVAKATKPVAAKKPATAAAKPKTVKAPAAKAKTATKADKPAAKKTAAPKATAKTTKAVKKPAAKEKKGE